MSSKNNAKEVTVNAIKTVSTLAASAGAGTVARGALNTLPVGSNPYVVGVRTFGAWALGAYAAKRASENLEDTIDETVDGITEVFSNLRKAKDNTKVQETEEN